MVNKKTKLLPVGIIVIAIILTSYFLIFSHPFTDTQISSSSTTEERQLYREVGSKHIPISAIDLFEKHQIHLTISIEEEEQITPLEDFFIMGYNIPLKTDIFAENPQKYSLSIEGKVEQPLNLSYSEILSEFEIKHIITELYCTPSLRGTAKFSGPSLYEVISRAHPVNENLKVVVIAGDGYQKGWSNEFPLTKIREHQDDFLLAVAMNGYPLASEHGYPVRLALTSEPGYNWVKWVTRIIILPEDASRSEYPLFFSFNEFKDSLIECVLYTETFSLNNKDDKSFQLALSH